jgi:hypothetical protein
MKEVLTFQHSKEPNKAYSIPMGDGFGFCRYGGQFCFVTMMSLIPLQQD